MVRRKGLKHIEVNETVTFRLGPWNADGFQKLQYSGFLNDSDDDFWYLPNHQNLVDQLMPIKRGSLVQATRLTEGHKNKACEYRVRVLRDGPKSSSQKTLDSF